MSASIADQKRYVKLNKEYRDLEPIVEAGEEYKLTVENLASSKEMLAKEKDDEFKEMAKMEIEELTNRKAELEEEIRILLIPKDPEDEKNATLEIRAGAGGDYWQGGAS